MGCERFQVKNLLASLTRAPVVVEPACQTATASPTRPPACRGLIPLMRICVAHTSDFVKESRYRQTQAVTSTAKVGSYEGSGELGDAGEAAGGQDPAAHSHMPMDIIRHG